MGFICLFIEIYYLIYMPLSDREQNTHSSTLCHLNLGAVSPFRGVRLLANSVFAFRP